MSEMPKEPSRLAQWIERHGDPDQLTVEYRATGTDTAETCVILTVTHSKKSIEVTRGEIGSDHYGYKDDVYLNLSHASIVEMTEGGRKRIDEWKAFQKKEARDLAEFARLRKKFTPTEA